jgi:hypothetical protein
LPAAGRGWGANVDRLAQQVADRDVALLDPRRDVRRHRHTGVAARDEGRAARAGEPDHAHPSPARGLDGEHHVLRRAARRDRDQHVARAAERLDLAREHLLVAVVVRDRGQRRRVGGERDPGERPALEHEPPDQLGGDVLRVGGAAAVAAQQHLMTGQHGVAQQIRGARDRVDVERVAHPRALDERLADQPASHPRPRR